MRNRESCSGQLDEITLNTFCDTFRVSKQQVRDYLADNCGGYRFVDNDIAKVFCGHHNLYTHKTWEECLHHTADFLNLLDARSKC